MSLDTVKQDLKARFSTAPDINAKIKFDFGDDGVLFIDATQRPPAVSNDDADADCTLICSAETFSAILNGTQDPNIAFMMDKLKVKGNMGLALKLNSILEE